MNKRIVITGLGIVSCIGIGKERFWDALIEGKSGISKIVSFDASDYPTHYGGEVKNFNIEDFIKTKKNKTLNRVSQMAIGASKLALEDAKLNLANFRSERIGVCLGTGGGGQQVLEETNHLWIKKGIDSLDSNFIFKYPCNILSANVAIEFEFKGFNITISTACASGNYAIGYGYNLIKSGKADIMFAGGADAFSKSAFAGFSRIEAMAPDKCQPFDKNRKGMLLGEGAGILILESLENALKRKANIYAEILGYSLNSDAYHMSVPQIDSIARLIKNALVDTDLRPKDIDYICAHGTGTVYNDKVECQAIKKVFKKYRDVPTSSIKSMLGHAMGAASAIETIACALVVKHDIIPPTINYETPDFECNIDCVPNVSRRQKVEIALNNAFAFGGSNACLVIKKFINSSRR